MKNNRPPLILLLMPPAAAILAGCVLLPGGRVTESATVVYTAGASQHTAAVEVPVEASIVHDALIRIIESNPDVVVINRNDHGMLVEVTQNSRRITGQVTKLGVGRSMLYIWADSGSSGQAGREMAISAVEKICDELEVEYKLVNY